jgi:L-fucose mutarotase/ribose pyranase (RbsD/FucU family)
MQRLIFNRTNVTVLLGLILSVSMSLVGCVSSEHGEWRSQLAKELPVLGHRNWIVIADSAYPAQSRAGIETIATGQDQIEVVKAVLDAVDEAEHVRANIYLDAELEHVSGKDARGIDAYRKELAALLEHRPVRSVPHEELIGKLDEAAKTFRVLILKTNLTLPYTSVFLELDCGYWDAGSEENLRQAIRRAL